MITNKNLIMVKKKKKIEVKETKNINNGGKKPFKWNGAEGN